jgi:hypothetical protein
LIILMEANMSANGGITKKMDRAPIHYSGGDKYVGEVSDGKRNGRGAETYSDGREYVGEWSDGKKNGQGTLTWPSGQKYVGQLAIHVERLRANCGGDPIYAGSHKPAHVRPPLSAARSCRIYCNVGRVGERLLKEKRTGRISHSRRRPWGPKRRKRGLVRLPVGMSKYELA